MTLVVQTSRMGYRGPDWLDVTLSSNKKRIDSTRSGKGNEPFGHRGMGFAFHPSHRILYPILSKRELLGGETEQEWEKFARAYTAEMRKSYVSNRRVWNELLTLERVVLLCFCVEPTRCHRTILARDILPKLGALYGGELPALADEQEEE